MALPRKITRLFSKLQKQKSGPKKLRIDTSRNSRFPQPLSPSLSGSPPPLSGSPPPLSRSPPPLSPSLSGSPPPLLGYEIKSPKSLLGSDIKSPRPLSESDIKFIIPPEIFIEICLHLAPQDLYSLSTVCKYFRNILWSTSNTTQTIWEKSRIKYSSYLKLPPPFDMTEQEYIWLTLLPKNCQFCSKPYKQYLYNIWPSRIVACESCFRKNTIYTIKDDRPRCIPREIFNCIPHTRYFYYEIFVIYWISDIELAKEEYNSLDKSQREEWIGERTEQVKRAKEVLNLYFQQDYQEVYKCGVFNPNRTNNEPRKKF
ncbi:6413_t:CDS:2 [Cetraspora pellucida]|uniref:6413_t:CDS:1 n=1 Tax=Cetraspora pellucida TaxID=1433469 RepID=A0A9N9A2C7_9GLOM|nr:6413_t:CDS:2 [Cetraspora pellucida]